VTMDGVEILDSDDWDVVRPDKFLAKDRIQATYISKSTVGKGESEQIRETMNNLTGNDQLIFI